MSNGIETELLSYFHLEQKTKTQMKTQRLVYFKKHCCSGKHFLMLGQQEKDKKQYSHTFNQYNKIG
uniref:Uncharacterized protein n=1 Tax=Anguilla anguilla TaxID=7936 RepID=A0A0E9XE91_ANGAN